MVVGKGLVDSEWRCLLLSMGQCFFDVLWNETWRLEVQSNVSWMAWSHIRRSLYLLFCSDEQTGMVRGKIEF